MSICVCNNCERFFDSDLEVCAEDPDDNTQVLCEACDDEKLAQRADDFNQRRRGFGACPTF